MESNVTKTCGKCGKSFPIWIVIEGKRKSLTQRVNCLSCCPLGKRISYKSPQTKEDFLNFEGSKEDLYYLVGFIAADGSLSKDGRHVELSQKNKHYLESLKEAFGFTANVRPCTGSGCYKLQIGSVNLWNFLHSIGLTPNKSATIGALKIPVDYEWSFLRGHFDGDGTLYMSLIKGKYKNWRMGILSKSTEFLDFIDKILIRRGIKCIKFYDPEKCSRLSLNGKHMIPFLKGIYSQGTLCLERKRLKSEECLKNFGHVAQRQRQLT